MLDSPNAWQAKKPEGEVNLEIDMINTVMADGLAIVPGVERIGGRTLRYVSDDYRNIYRMILTAAMVGGRFVDFK